MPAQPLVKAQRREAWGESLQDAVSSVVRPRPYGRSAFTLPALERALRAHFNQLSGTPNDFIQLFVGPDFNSLTLYGTSGWNGVGIVTDPTGGAFRRRKRAGETACPDRPPA